jgi:outer membrane protein assembly factor BamD (BamD/ComL family)
MRLGNFLLVPLAVLILASSCLSGPVNIPDELTPAEIVQRAQEASDRNRYKVSLQYYETILERFPQDMESVCGAEYEIAFIQYKQKKYEEAKAGFTSLLSRYDGLDGELLPPQYKILSGKIMGVIAEIERKQAKINNPAAERPGYVVL